MGYYLDIEMQGWIEGGWRLLLLSRYSRVRKFTASLGICFVNRVVSTSQNGKVTGNYSFS